MAVVKERRAARIGLLAVSGLTLCLALGPAPAMASTIFAQDTTLEIDGDVDDDVITVTTDGTLITVTDTGTGGATAALNCDQVNGTTVTCPAHLPGEDFPLLRFSVQLDGGVDSFTNQNFVTRSGFVAGGTGSTTVNAGPGQQTVFGGTSDDVLNGGEGNDFMQDGADEFGPSLTGGNDVIDGGPGEDTAEYFRLDTPVNVSLDGVANDGIAGEADNVIAENVRTGNGNDVITGDAGRNSFFAGDGSDLVNGLGGNDTLVAGNSQGGLAPRRGIGGFEGDDTVIGGTGRDELFCGTGFDVGIRDPLDRVSPDCERIGASVAGDTATVGGKKKNKLKVALTCPESEGAPCTGKLKLRANGKKVGKGKFSVAAGKTKNGSAKVSKNGQKALRKAGGRLLVTVRALTSEPGGLSEDSGQILVRR